MLKTKCFKILLILISLLSFNEGFSQTKYFLFEEDNKDFIASSFKLNTYPLYKIKREVHLFNVMSKVQTFIGNKGIYNGQHDYNIMLFSILPDLDGSEDWYEINLDTVRSSMINFKNLEELHKKNTLSYFNTTVKQTTKYFNDYKLIIKKGKTYYAPKYCLLQFYSVRNRPQAFTNVYGTINTQDSAYSVLQFEKIFKGAYPGLQFPLYRIGEDPLSFLDWSRDRREYLSKKITLAHHTAGYQFWTYIDWTQYEYKYDFERGIDRFVYAPGKGIIGGSFDFYFYYHRKKLPIKYSDFLNNIKEEKVMIIE
ncbi:hypothetical protein [Sphingobacterium sp.]|uniref:hypothetical protein n=1 Tax=Sphingobacterium sp. TaxID=341027 RepID=UPI0031CFA102